ncbi:MAG: phosphoglycerate kinase [bacterium]
MEIPEIQNLDLKHKRVFLRADLNVPLKNKKISQDFKLQSILPTIDYILKNGGKVILATHIGQPNAKSQTNFFDENLSTKILVPWFKKNGYEIKYEIDLKKAELESKQNFKQILLLENLRFFNGEQEQNLEFAQLLSNLADIYINDAFGVSHRNDASVTLLPQLFDKNHKAFGFLIEKEIKNLTKLKQNPEQPFMLVVGGNKIKDKIPLLKNFINQKLAQSILIGGAIAQPFLKKEGITNEILAQKNNAKIVLPTDFIKIDNEDVDIGPESIKIFENEIKRAKTIFANGTMGIYEKEESENGTKQILNAIANSDAFTVIGGGDAVAATFMFDLSDKIDFLSTGGGAMLAFLSCEKPFIEMPGLNSITVN